VEILSHKYKWYILSLVVLTNILVIAMPSMGMSVMAKEISQDLGLNLVQVGVVWGVGSLPAILTNLIGGAVGDKVGAKRVLILSTLLAGLLGAARGLAFDFISMIGVVILLGSVIPFVIMNGLKTIGQWFPSHQLGLANGLFSAGMGLGFLLGAFFSATTFSPLLGGWRNVLIVYGLAGALLSIAWQTTRTVPLQHPTSRPKLSLRAAVFHVARLKNIWLLGLMLFGIGGCIQGVIGYLPLYLRGLDWEPIQADGALSAFHTMSTIFVLPIALWSDRLRSRKRLLFSACLMVGIGAGLLSFASGNLIWLAVLLTGFARDGIMAVFTTMVYETEGVDLIYAGTAIGLTMAIGGLGSVLAPPLGNSLAVLWPGAPFALWSGLALGGIICLSMVKGEKPVRSS
jgi:ACS family glucarate transporter-like MFS transporter